MIRLPKTASRDLFQEVNIANMEDQTETRSACKVVDCYFCYVYKRCVHMWIGFTSMRFATRRHNNVFNGATMSADRGSLAGEMGDGWMHGGSVLLSHSNLFPLFQ